jgi:hypothetical protein
MHPGPQAEDQSDEGGCFQHPPFTFWKTRHRAGLTTIVHLHRPGKDAYFRCIFLKRR